MGHFNNSTYHQANKEHLKLSNFKSAHQKSIVLVEQTHVHFSNGSSLNIDGTWKDGKSIILSKSQTEWLAKHGWKLPNE